jgi:hypothetical protein
MIKYTCIGRSRIHSNEIVQCQAVSETPTNPAHPEWGFLCHDCANERSARNTRPQLQVDLPDTDKPNFETDVIESYPFRASQEEMDLEDFDRLEELDLL